MVETTKSIVVAQPEKARSKSQSQVVWEQFRGHQLAVFGGLVLIALYVGAIFAPFISPYGMTEYSISDLKDNHPPTRLYFRDPESGAFGVPFVYASKRVVSLETFLTEYKEDRTQKCELQFFVHRPEVPYKILGLIPSDLHLFGVPDSCRIFLLGTDHLGRDLMTRIWFGSQISLTIGFFSSFIVFVLGLGLGGLAGYYGGWIDNLIMRATEIISSIPTLILLVSLTAFLPKDLDPIVVFYGIVLILGVVGWDGLARTVRSQILALREVDYVQAAIAIGASPWRVIAKHMLPSTASYLIVSLSLAIPGFILAESGLSFIGRGIREPYSSWGLLLNDVTEGGFASFVFRPWILIPGFFIVLTILCWNFLGDGLRDAFDPKKRQ